MQAYAVVMEKPLRLVGVSALIGVSLGGIYGFGASLDMHCAADYVTDVPGATCFRLLGRFVSGSTYYTVVVGVVGMAIGVALGSFMAIPMMLWRRERPGPRMHLLENPAIWFGLQVAEFAVAVVALLFLPPDPGVWPEGLRWAVAAVTLIALMILNYGLRRRFIPR